MKSLIKYIILLSISFSCSEKIQMVEMIIFDSGLEEFGFATAKVNGKEWRASAAYSGSISLPDDLYNIHLLTYTEHEQWLREVMSFGSISEKELGKTKLFPAYVTNNISDTLLSVYSISSGGGDSSGSGYDIDPSYDNWIKITHADTVAHELIGNFQCRFLLRESYDGRSYPTVLTYKDGYFKCKKGNL